MVRFLVKCWSLGKLGFFLWWFEASLCFTGDFEGNEL